MEKTDRSMSSSGCRYITASVRGSSGFTPGTIVVGVVGKEADEGCLEAFCCGCGALTTVEAFIEAVSGLLDRRGMRPYRTLSFDIPAVIHFRKRQYWHRLRFRRTTVH